MGNVDLKKTLKITNFNVWSLFDPNSNKPTLKKEK